MEENNDFDFKSSTTCAQQRVRPARQLVLTNYFLVPLNLFIAFQSFLRASVYFS